MVRSIFHSSGLASCRRRPLSSNVRPHDYPPRRARRVTGTHVVRCQHAQTATVFAGHSGHSISGLLALWRSRWCPDSNAAGFLATLTGHHPCAAAPRALACHGKGPGGQSWVVHIFSGNGALCGFVLRRRIPSSLPAAARLNLSRLPGLQPPTVCVGLKITRSSQPASVYQCGLTPRSSGAPTAGHQGPA